VKGATELLIDCDIHVSPRGLQGLYDYLDAPTLELVVHSGGSGLQLPNYPWYHPTGWVRHDVWDPTSPDPFVSEGGLEKVRTLVLDENDTTFGICTPDGIAGGICVMPNPNLAEKLARAHNDWMLDEYLTQEPRLRGLITVAPQHPEAAAKEIRRVGARDEFVGLFLPGAARVPYGNPIYDPIWEATAELGLPVIVHTHFEGVGIAGPVTAAGYPDYYIEYHTLCGSGMYGHFVSILCHGIFERFPGSKLMMVEGGVVPFVGFLWRLDTNWKSCRSEVPWVRKPPSEYVWENVRFATQPLETPDDESLLAPAIQGLRPWDTLCFASDYPHWDYDEPKQTLRMLPAEWRENVAWKNAAEFYRLPVPAIA
jgi:predicted TIM-barrel fold metal-dependent hydrolase